MALVPAKPSLSQPAKPHRWPIFTCSRTCLPERCGNSLKAKVVFCLGRLGLGQRRVCLPRRVLVLPFSEFEHLFEDGPTELVYVGTPVSGLTQHEQGRVCQEWAKKVLQEKHLDAEMLDPERATCGNGRRRGSSQALYDFVSDGRKVEAKGARIAWSSGG